MITHLALALLAAAAIAAPETDAAVDTGMEKTTTAEEAAAALEETVPLPVRRWFLVVGLVNTYPKLESEELIERFLNRPLNAIAPSFDDVRTVGDLRDSGLIWPPHIGIGYQINDYWGVFLQAGYSAGTITTESTDTTLLVLPLHTDFALSRGAAFMGVGVDYYPWRAPKLANYATIAERLRAARPALGARVTYTHATYDVKVGLRLGPVGDNFEISLSDSWTLPSLNLNVGVDIPVDYKNVLFLNAGYNFFWQQEQDFEGAAFTLGWKYFFR